MAVRFDGTSDQLSRTTNLPPATGYTVMGLFQITTDRNTYSAFISYGTVGTACHTIQTDSDGTTFAIWNGGNFAAGSALTAGTWYHLALVSNGSDIFGYINGVQNISVGYVAPGAALRIGNDVDSEWLNGRVAGIKIYDAALTAAEIAQEMLSITPVRLANLNGWYPCFAGATERLADYSGNGRNWTAGGTLTDEDGPGVAWDLWLPNASTAAAGGSSIALNFAAASLSSTPDTVPLAVARGLTLAAASLSTTPDDISLLVARALTIAAASLSTTPDDISLLVARALTIAAASLSTTPDTVPLAVGRALTLAAVSLSSTPDDIPLAVARALALSAASLSTTGDIALLVAGFIDLTMAVASLSSTLDTVPLAVGRALTLAASSLSTTPDTVPLAVVRALTLAAASLSTTPDTVPLAVARGLTLAAASLSTTGDIALLVAGLIDLTMAVASLSSTPNSVPLSVARGLTLAAGSLSTTPDTVPLAVARGLTLAAASSSTTPDTVPLVVGRALTLAAALLSSTGNIPLDFISLLAAMLDHVFLLFPRRASFVLRGERTVAVPAARRAFEAHLMAVAEVPKDPAEVVDYALDYTSLLDGDTIATSAWAVDSGDVVVNSETETTTTTTVRISAGTLSTKAKIKNTVVTAGGQTLVRRLVIVLQEM